MRFDNTLIVNASDASVTIISSPVTLESIYGFAIQSVFTGSPVGTLKLQASCDPGTVTAGAYGTNVNNWNDIPGYSTAISSSGNTMYNLDAQFYKWVRLVYTATSGTGTLSARFNAKGV